MRRLDPLASSLLSCVIAVALLVCGACAPSYYDAYRQAHPAWAPTRPALGMDLAETIASMHVPHYTESDVVTRVRTLQVFELVSSTPKEVDIDTALAESNVDYLVRVSTHCFHNEKLDASYYNDASAAYLVQDGELRAAFDVRLGYRCSCEPSELGDPGDLEVLRDSLAGFDSNPSPCMPWGGWDREDYR